MGAMKNLLILADEGDSEAILTIARLYRSSGNNSMAEYYLSLLDEREPYDTSSTIDPSRSADNN